MIRHESIRRSLLTIAALLLGMLPASVGAQPPGAEVLQEAEMIFVGTVRATGVAAEADVEASERTVSVRVEEILRPSPPSPLAGFANRDVTVQLRQPGSPAVGERATFYTRLWTMGRGLALIELAHRAPAAGAAERFLAEHGDRELSARLAEAEVVVVGRVKAIREPQTAALAPPRLSEHDPVWREAIIEVEEGIKGVAATTRDISVLFPASEDVMWADAAKFEIGQEGVFILGAEEVTGTNLPATALVADESGGTIVDPENVLAKAEAERVKRLLNQ